MDCCGHLFPRHYDKHQAVMEARKKLRNCPYSALKGRENPQCSHSTIELVLEHLNATREVHLNCFVCTTDVLFN